MSKLGLAISIAAKAFENKVDKGGKPYILHCLWVMNRVSHLGEEVMITAALHDLCEDCKEDGYTFEFLTKQGFSDKIIGWLHLLTHDKENTPYDEYIKAISVSKEATAIKLADLDHNSQISRIKGLRKKDIERIEKYHRSYIYLSN